MDVRVVHVTDAALAAGLEESAAVLVGADAVAPHAWLNKTGTFMLAAAAGVKGIPVYVAATPDKFAMPALWPWLALREGASDEVWGDPPTGTQVRNPYFEWIPLDLVTGVITDAGILGSGMVVQVCESMQDERMLAALARLTSEPSI
jgi:translation initiation factor 2B subunit (eIF-2B alpha/beta/delta family)